MKINLVILSTASDMSAKRLADEGKKLFDKVYHEDYQDILTHSLPTPLLPSSGQNTILIPRQPYAANKVEENYVGLLDIILKKYTFQVVLDRSLYRSSFVQYEDKFFQSHLFDNLHVPYAQLFSPLEIPLSEYPIIAKKRLSSRALSNFILTDESELHQFIFSNDCAQFIFQKFYPLQSDYRLLILKNKPLGVVKRKVKLKDGNRATVEVIGISQLPDAIINQGLQIVKAVGTDLCGIDVGQKEDGSYFFIEYNTSPQFEGFERETGRNIAGEVLQNLLVTSEEDKKGN